MKIETVLNPQQQAFDAFVRSVPEAFDRGGRTIYRQRNEIKVFETADTILNIKRYRKPHLPNRVAYTFFRPPKAERAYRYAFRLRELGIDTPEPVAYILLKKNGLLHMSYYVSRQAPHDHTMYEFGRGGLAGREYILQALAGFTARLHEAGVCHRDYSPGNILFRETPAGVEFCLVDINRMRFGPVSVREGCAAFARLWGPEPMFRLLAEGYAKARGAEVEPCVRRTLYCRRRFWNASLRRDDLPFDWK
ncbi:MAG: lipopolysaccharide kinase InaA family protein [Tannerella sp.]|jgi:tRNA A-37 threonylcarbamoyl transferase component Bud32|nr:lipopolysaccharide kinase InaA family protein [Tannerella sp.]